MSDLEPNPSGINRRLALREADHSWTDHIERLKYANEYAQGALKGLFIANGASIVSLLTFLGNENGSHIDRSDIWWAFFWFTLGLAAVLSSYIIGYVTHAHYMQAALQYSRQADRAAHEAAEDPKTQDYGPKGNRAENFGICFTVLSMVFFITGAFVALDAIT